MYEVLAAESAAAAAALLPLLKLDFIVTTLIPLFYEIQFKLKIIELNLNNSYLDISYHHIPPILKIENLNKILSIFQIIFNVCISDKEYKTLAA